jgi:hypothetical protein
MATLETRETKILLGVTMATQTRCPACEEYIFVRSGININAKLRCPECYADLVVVKLKPTVLDWDDYAQDDDDDMDDWDDDEDISY